MVKREITRVPQKRDRHTPMPAKTPCDTNKQNHRNHAVGCGKLLLHRRQGGKGTILIKENATSERCLRNSEAKFLADKYSLTMIKSSDPCVVEQYLSEMYLHKE